MSSSNTSSNDAKAKAPVADPIWTVSELKVADDGLKADKSWTGLTSKYENFIASDEAVARTAAALTEKKHVVTVVSSPAEALSLLTSEKYLPKGTSVAFGGSITLEQIGFLDAVKSRTDLKNYRAEALAAMMKGDWPASAAIRVEGTQKAEYFYTSINAITEDGAIVVADASGTRTAPFIGGAKNVVIVASANKIVPTLPEALDRLEKWVVPIEGAHMRKVYKMPGTSLVNTVVVRGAGMSAGRIKIILVKGHSLGY